MRKVYLRLTHDSDLRAQRRALGVWHLGNRANHTAVVHQGALRRGIVSGCYIADRSNMGRDKILSGGDYLYFQPLDQ